MFKKEILGDFRYFTYKTLDIIKFKPLLKIS